MEYLYKLGDDMLCLFDTIGLDIFGKHTLGNINSKDNIDPFPFDCLQLSPYLGIGKGYDNEDKNQSKENQLHPWLKKRALRHQAGESSFLSKVLTGFCFPKLYSKIE